MNKTIGEIMDSLVMSIVNNKLRVLMILVIILSITITISNTNKYASIKREIAELKENATPNKTKDMEFGYFEGQRDYMHGDIRIAVKDDDYIFIRSPWDLA